MVHVTSYISDYLTVFGYYSCVTILLAQVNLKIAAEVAVGLRLNPTYCIHGISMRLKPKIHFLLQCTTVVTPK